MRTVITLIDREGGGIGFSVQAEQQPQDYGITDVGYLAHQLTETLQRIATDMQQLNHPRLDKKLAQAFIRSPHLCSEDAQ